MEKQEIIRQMELLAAQTPGNILTAQNKIQKRYIGTAMFDSPLVGFGTADDALFETFRDASVIGPWHMKPEEWLPGAKAVISFFFPMSDAVLKSNRSAGLTGSTLWAYARIDGQQYIAAYSKALCDWFRAEGYEACAPAIDPRFEAVRRGKGITGYAEINERTYGSRWSERHAAYVCGLGTFGLSKGLITERGMAGRFGSVIVSAPLDADPRPYTGIYDYCIRCGACIRRCPAKAITLETGKDHRKCHRRVTLSGVLHYPRYGCGLCQTKVPCERSRPGKR